MKIDKIYCVNLETRKDRKDKMINLFNSLGGIFKNTEFFNAVYGKNIPKEELNSLLSSSAWYSLNINHSDYRQIRNLGAVGCYLSHYIIWKEIVDKNYENVIIFEDDIECNKNYNYIMNIINTTPKDYDLAYLSYFTFSQLKLEDVNENWNKSTNTNIFATNAYMISNTGAKKLLSNALPIDLQIDVYMGIQSIKIPNFKRYLCKDDLFPQESILQGSDIQGICPKCIITEVSELIINQDFINFIIILVILFLVLKYL